MSLLLLLALAVGVDSVEDFEDGLPEGWERVLSEAHPPYNTIELIRDPRAAKSGDQFLRMRSLGGSTAYRLRRAWAVDPSKPYRLSVFARLTGTRRNAAVATLTWFNAGGERVGETRSALATKPGEWTELVVDVARVPAGAVAAAPRLDFEGDDVRGLCDFDRLVFAPFTRLEVRPAGRPTAVFSPEEYPRFTVALAGAPPGTHGVTAVMKTAQGAEIRRSAVLRGDESGTIDFPPPSPGAHELTLSIDGSSERRSFAVLVPNPWPATGDQTAPIPLPLLAAVVQGDTLDAEGRPTAWWLAEKSLFDVLTGAAEMAAPDLFPAGVHVAAFRRADSAILAVWSDQEMEIPVTLNDGAKLFPPTGAIRRMRTGERLKIGPLPQFLVGIDPMLLEMRLHLSGPDLPLQLNPTTRTLRLRNPLRTQPLRDVRVKVVEMPPGWRVSPLAIGAPALAADGEFAEDLQFVLPPTETARLHPLTFEVSFLRDGKERTVRLSRLVRVGAALSIDAAVSTGPRPGSKSVTVRITNASDRPMTLLMRARIPQHPEQNEIVRDLAPGATSAPFTYVVKDVSLLDPAHVTAEIDVRESVGSRAAARRLIPLR